MAYPLVLQIDPPPPVLVGVLTSAGNALGAAESAAPGDTITLVVSGMASGSPLAALPVNRANRRPRRRREHSAFTVQLGPG